MSRIIIKTTNGERVKRLPQGVMADGSVLAQEPWMAEARMLSGHHPVTGRPLKEQPIRENPPMMTSEEHEEMKKILGIGKYKGSQ